MNELTDVLVTTHYGTVTVKAAYITVSKLNTLMCWDGDHDLMAAFLEWESVWIIEPES